MLNGRSALIVEEEFLIALDIQRMLENLHVGQTLFARSTAEAEQLRARWPDIGLAVIEIHLDDIETTRLVEALTSAGVPVVLTTADVAVRRGFSTLPDLPIVIKPMPEAIMASAIRQALAARS